MLHAQSDTAGVNIIRFVFELFFAFTGVAAFTTLILWSAGANPLKTYHYLLIGSLGSMVKFSHVVSVWIPLTLCSCGLLYTFRIGLWNIGVEGQVMMGAVFATWVLRYNYLPPALSLILAFGAGIFGGAAWALFTGYLKAKAGINEIFVGLGLNFVAQGGILWLIFGPWKRPGVASMSGTEVFSNELWLPVISWLRLSPVSLAMVACGIVLTYLILNRSRLGLILKAIGQNPAAAFLYNLKPNTYLLIAMMFAGGFSGMAGTIQVSGVYHRLIPAISSSYGYLALLVVMLANYKVWLAPIVAFIFACLNVGSIQLPMVLQLDSSLSGVIQGTLVLATLVANFLRQRKMALTQHRRS